MSRRRDTSWFAFLVCASPVFRGQISDKVAAGSDVRANAVTYNDHYVSGSPEWKINDAWLQRVADVVGIATSKGFHVITNIHHGV